MAIKRIPMKKHPNIYWYQTRSGRSYSVRKQYTDVDGTPKQFSKSGFSNWRDAEQALRKFESQLFDGTIATAQKKRIKLNAYFDKMSDRKKKMGIWKNSTAKATTSYYDQYFRTTFGKENIQEISRMKYQAFIDDLALNHNLAKSTLHRIDSVMQQIMNDADVNDVITKNKLRHIVINGGKEAKSQTLTEADFDSFMKTAKEILTKYEYGFVKLLTLGQRRGEMMGLRKSSFKFQRDEVNKKDICAITFNLARTADNPKGTTLKTDSSYRTIWVADEYVDWIKYCVDYSDRILADHDMEVTPDHFIWLNPATGHPYHVQYSNTIMARVSRKSGITLHPHILRHYFATKARSKALSQTDVMHWLGHTSITMTDSYTRETPEGAMKVFRGIEKDI